VLWSFPTERHEALQHGKAARLVLETAKFPAARLASVDAWLRAHARPESKE
jgi:hypothetical protein